MATPETWNPSRRMRAAAAAEHERVERELHRLRAREQHLGAEIAGVRIAQEGLEAELRALERFTNEHPDRGVLGAVKRRLRAVAEDSVEHPRVDTEVVLRGAGIRKTAVRVLADSTAAGQPIHYRDLYELLRQRGFRAAGKDPLATFLTQIGRSPVVVRSTSAGMYSLDIEFPERARARLAKLRAELEATRGLAADAGVDDIARARERRAGLTREVDATERALEEALRSLGEASG
jgi:hypothetical protein